MKAMLPLISANDNWNVRRQQSRSNALASLPTFTATMYTGFAPFERTTSPWKHHVPNRNSALRNEESPSEEDETKMSTKPFTHPNSVGASRSFRSSTILRQVPIMRRHLDTFGGRMFSIPMKTKSVPVHTERFIYDPLCPPLFAEKLSQNQRLQAEIEMMKKVRGQKRKREAIEHRWGWRNFDLSGMEVMRSERYSIQAEVQKLKELVLPPAAREIYTGRGIRLPSTHQTVNPNPPRLRLYTEGPKAPQPTRRGATFPTLRGTAVTGTTALHTSAKAGGRWEASVLLQSDLSRPSTELQIQSIPAPGTQQPAPTPVRPETVETPSEPPPVEKVAEDHQTEGPTPVNYPQTPQMHEQVEKIEVIDPEQEEEERIKSELAVIPETPIERPRSLAAPSASPETYAPNPILPIDKSHTEPLISEELQKILKQKFEDLEKKGNVSMRDILALSSENLTENQRNYLLCLHEVSSQGSPLVYQELIAYTCLSQIIQNLSPSTAEMFEQCDFSTISESVVQYTELFNSVDRTSRGQIGVMALVEILKTTLQRQITEDEKLLNQVLETIDKEKDGEISKLEFLAYIPYFMHLEDMS